MAPHGRSAPERNRAGSAVIGEVLWTELIIDDRGPTSSKRQIFLLHEHGRFDARWRFDQIFLRMFYCVLDRGLKVRDGRCSMPLVKHRPSAENRYDEIQTPNHGDAYF